MMKYTKKWTPLLCVGMILPLGSAQALFILLDDFEGATPGALGSQNGWTSDANYSVAVDPANSSNQVLQYAAGAQAGTPTGAYLALGGSSISEGNMGTLFARFRFDSTGNGNFGFSDVAAPSVYGDFEAQVSRQSGTSIRGRDGASFQDLSPLASDVDIWYNIWIVSDNSADTSQIYIQSDDDATFSTQMLVTPPDGTLNFRNGTTDALSTLKIRSQDGTVLFDDFFISTGADLSNPTIPEPSSLALLFLSMTAVFRRKRG